MVESKEEEGASQKGKAAKPAAQKKTGAKAAAAKRPSPGTIKDHGEAAGNGHIRLQSCTLKLRMGNNGDTHIALYRVQTWHHFYDVEMMHTVQAAPSGGRCCARHTMTRGRR